MKCKNWQQLNVNQKEKTRIQSGIFAFFFVNWAVLSAFNSRINEKKKKLGKKYNKRNNEENNVLDETKEARE